ncbi:heterokaryon incompatibility protein-domain-containing protein, partial [Hyaloscypha sp. PMI_1271]
MQEQEYSYDSINPRRQLRLLRLKPGDHDAPLCGEIFPANIETAESLHKFEALSYVWGDSAKVDVIETSKGCIPITCSLSRALRAYRRPQDDRILWADAICIDQKNNAEKSKAVEIMADAVYGKADRVQIFLGEESDDSNLAGELLNCIAEEKWDREKVRRDKARSESNSEKWQALEAVLRRPWFRRVWVVQEFVVSKEAIMTCGAWSVNAETMLLVAWYFHCELCQPLHILLFLQRAQQVRERPDLPQHTDFSLVLHAGKRLDATLARDHLFAFFSFTNDPRIREHSEYFHVDYDEPFPSVVRRYAKGFLESGGGGHLLYYAGLDTDSDRFPSWIPNWCSK